MSKKIYSILKNHIINFNTFCITILISFVFFRTGTLNDPGVGWHITSFSSLNPLSSRYCIDGESSKWINSQWLIDYLSSVMIRVFPFNYEINFKFITAIVVITTFILIPLNFLKNEGYNNKIIFITILLTATLGFSQAFFRPVIFGFLLFSLFFYRFIDAIKNDNFSNSFYSFLFFIFLIWSNTHPSFVIGFICIAIFSIFQVIRKRTFDILLCFIPIFATLINPFGYKLYLLIFSLGTSKYFQNLNQEWQSLLVYDSSIAAYFFTLIICSYLLIRKCSRSKNKELTDIYLYTMSFIFIALSFYSRRYLPFCAIIIILPLASSLNLFFPQKTKTNSSNLGFISVSVLVFFIINFFDFNQKSFADTCWSKTILRSDLESPLLNHPNEGGLISFLHYEKGLNLCPTIDDRNILNGEAKYKKTLELFKGKKLEHLKDYSSALVHSMSPLHKNLSTKKDWVKITNNKNCDYSIWKKIVN